MSDENPKLTFSQRNGYEDLPPQMKLEEISESLRREIWNRIWYFLEANKTPRFPTLNSSGKVLVRIILSQLLERPAEEISVQYEEITEHFRKIIMKGEFNYVIELLEIIANMGLKDVGWHQQRLQPKSIATLFEEHAAAYYLRTDKEPYWFFQRTSKQESDATQASIKALQAASGFDGALAHLDKAADHLRQNEYADSIHDSISAVESVARVINPDANTLGKALKNLEGSQIIKHAAFKQAIGKLYGYTSDEEGIRHPLIKGNEANVGLPDALFFFNACAAFCGYLATLGKVK